MQAIIIAVVLLAVLLFILYKFFSRAEPSKASIQASEEDTKKRIIENIKICQRCEKKLKIGYTCRSCGREVCFACIRKHNNESYCLDCIKKETG